MYIVLKEEKFSRLFLDLLSKKIGKNFLTNFSLCLANYPIINIFAKIVLIEVKSHKDILPYYPVLVI